jgi:transcription elongation GreA/GreB family factor
MNKKPSVLFTESGFHSIQKEYNDLLHKRPEFVEELTRARDMGDRSENAAYKSARRRLSSTDSRLRFLKRIVDNAKVVKPSQADSVEIGSIVTVDNGRQKIIFTIVGEHEADPMNRKLSYRSPVGQALLRRHKGDSVQIAVPSGTIEYSIVEIKIS